MTSGRAEEDSIVPVSGSESTSYDDVPYRSFPFPQTHPSRLATISWLMGNPAPLGPKLRVLEIGCSSGGNLLPLCEQFPEGEFLGIDASRVAIEEGRRISQDARLKNVRLEHADIVHAPIDGRFDYVICHGVYSWVPNVVQDRILEVCQNHLAPNGVAYISYNTNPGWRLRGMIRDLMLYRANFFSDPKERLSQSRELIEFLARSVPIEKSPYGKILNDEIRFLREREDYYLIHEFLEDVNQPVYFHEFADRAERHRLQYLGEADYSMMLVNNFPPTVSETIGRLSSDVVQIEQYMDFLRNRTFRQTLLCHNDIALNRDVTPERLARMSIATNAELVSKETIETEGGRVSYRRSGSTLTTAEPLVQAAMQVLVERWPDWTPFCELVAEARSRIAAGPVLISPERNRREEFLVAEPLLKCYSIGLVDLTVLPIRPELTVPALPCATRLSRIQAQSGFPVTNLWHNTVGINDLERRVLWHSDGTRDRNDLADALTEDILSDRLIAHDGGRRVDDRDSARRISADVLESTLSSLGRKGLFTRQIVSEHS